jgi:hypothetical protein
MAGIDPGQVGPLYDLAIGQDAASLVGYVVPKEGTFREATQLREKELLITVASPNLVDRELTNWPQVSQGQWNGGERQEVFVDPTKFFSSQGVETSLPGRLSLYSSPTPITSFPAITGTSSPFATDGFTWYFGVQGIGYNLIYGNGAGPASTTQIGPAGTVIYSLTASAAAVYAATSTGIYIVNLGGASTQMTADIVDPAADPSIAYFGGQLYYVQVGGVLKHVQVTAPYAVVTDTTLLVGDGTFQCIAATVNGLFLATNVATFSAYTLLFTWNGSALTRVGDIPGEVRAAREANGTVYILALLRQYTGITSYTLLALTGSTLTVLDDLRYANPAFQTSNVQFLPPLAQLDHDGRFLYIAWPGVPLKRFDLAAQSGMTTIGPPFPTGQQKAHRVVSTATGVIQIMVPLSGNAIAGAYTGILTAAGTLTSSDVDFSTPFYTKVFRSCSVILASTAVTSVALAFAVDGGAFVPVTAQSGGPPSLLTFLLPPGTKGRRVAIRLTLTPQAGVSPIVRSLSIKATLARVFQFTVSARRSVRTRNGELDEQGLRAVDLIANVQRIYDNAGQCVLAIPSAKAGSYATGAPYVETINAVLEDYNLTTAAGVSPAYRQPDGDADPDMERDCELTFNEVL